jgi:membrane associated rhomboid family serine protease
MSITYIIIGFTVLVSFWAFNDRIVFAKLMHRPYDESRRGEHYRWLTSGFLHGDMTHLLFNMISLLFFGPTVEEHFDLLLPGFSKVAYLIFYLLSILAASSATFVKHKDNPTFASIGASGAVSAVVFAAILFEPLSRIGMFFLPPIIPGFIYGIFYLWYSSYAANHSNDNIDHTAHLYGALFGFGFPIVFQPSLLLVFINKVVGWF